MVTCSNPLLAPSTCYKKYKCRCSRCLDWKKEAASRTNNKQRAAERSRLWRLKNPEKSRLGAKNYQKNNPDKLLQFQLKKYGLTVLQYKELITNQLGLCAICGMPSPKRLCIDHDAYTGKVRGLLCGACNVGIGHFNHSPYLLKQAIKYLVNNQLKIKENGDVY